MRRARIRPAKVRGLPRRIATNPGGLQGLHALGRAALLDEAYLDVADNLKGIPTAWETAKEIRARIYEETKLTASAGVSCNMFLAKLASDHRKPNGQFAIMPDEAEAFVATLPVVKFHGVGPKTAAKMHALGIETGADLRSQTLASLQGHFGKSGSWYYEISRGRDDRPVRPDRERKSSGSERTFPENLTDPAGIEAGVIEMAEDVWRWCEKTHSRGRTVTVKIDRERKSSGSERTFPEDLTDPAGIEAGVIEMAEDVWRWCEKTHSRGRTVTVKIKWADFQISTLFQASSAVQAPSLLKHVEACRANPTKWEEVVAQTASRRLFCTGTKLQLILGISYVRIGGTDRTRRSAGRT